MSRTDVHAPYILRVRRREAPLLPDHASAHADCDLPSPEVADWETTRCTWSIIARCNCALCYNGVGHRRDLRRERRRAAAELVHRVRRWNRGDAAAFDEVLVPRRRRDWW